MYDGATRPLRARPGARPRWGVLYGIAVLAAAALLAVEIGLAPGAIRTVLDVTVVCGTFAGLGAAMRSQRAALDLQDWCDCASDRTTVQVIPSRAPAATGDHRREFPVLLGQPARRRRRCSPFPEGR